MLSRHYAPPDDLVDYVARLYVLSVDMADDRVLTDRVMSETAILRVPVAGRWEVEAVPGDWQPQREAAFFGPNSRSMQVRVQGSFVIVGAVFCPAASRALFDQPMRRFAEQVVPFDDVVPGLGRDMRTTLQAMAAEAQGSDAPIIAAVAAWVRAILDARGWPRVSRSMQEFEAIARNDSTVLVRDAAARVGLNVGKFERDVCAHFGMTPKMVLRRSRFLDMAAALRGFSRPSEEVLATLRFYDQSHINREFRRFVAMTPGQFQQTPTPLLNAGLELRQMRKEEDAARLGRTA